MNRKKLFPWDSLDGESFQGLCVDLLLNEGFEVEDQGIGPDGGVDIIAKQKVTVHSEYDKTYTWAVQVKYRQKPSATVKPNELGNIGNILSRFGADGYLLVTNGRVTNKSFSEIRSISEGNPPNFLTNVWDNRVIESKLLKHDHLRKRYFGFVEENGILLVDDEMMSLRIFTDILSSLGHPVYCASSVEHAMKIARKHNIEVAILDIMMPSSAASAPFHTAGFDLAKQLKEIKPDVKIIYNSAYIGSVEIAARAGLENAIFLSKFDYGKDKLVEAVSDALATPREIAIKATQFDSITTYVNSSLHRIVNRLNLAGILADSIPESKKSQDMKKLLSEVLASLKTIIKDMAFERFSQQQGSFREVELSTIINSAIKVSSLSHGSLYIDYEPLENDVVLYCDSRTLESAISNIIDNAIESVKNTDEIKVKVEVAIVKREKTFVKISVFDNGQGISREMIPKLYCPSFSTKGGSGMGFFLAHKVAEYHGGWTEVESPADKWATEIKIYVPIKRID